MGGHSEGLLHGSLRYRNKSEHPDLRSDWIYVGDEKPSLLQARPRQCGDVRITRQAPRACHRYPATGGSIAAAVATRRLHHSHPLEGIAVDVDALTRDVTPFFSCQKCDGVRDILGLAHEPERTCLVHGTHVRDPA